MVNGKDQALVTNPLIIDFTSLAPNKQNILFF